MQNEQTTDNHHHAISDKLRRRLSLVKLTGFLSLSLSQTISRYTSLNRTLFIAKFWQTAAKTERARGSKRSQTQTLK